MEAATLGSRAWFGALEPRVYLNHASVSPPSAPVCDAVNEWMATYARLGLGAVGPVVELRGELKARLGRLLGCSSTDLALTSSTSDGLFALSTGIAFGPDDRIIGFRGEFPANVTCWDQAAKASGARLELLDQEGLDDDAVLDGVEDALRLGGVRLIAVSAVQFSTGRRMPIEGIVQLAHAHGALVVVDAIQAVGVVPLDVVELGADFLCGGAHKWLMGIEGTGYVYAAPAALEHLTPRAAGWLSHTDPVRFLSEGAGLLSYDRPIRQGIDFLEAHSSSAIGSVALWKALEATLSLGIEAIEAHVRGLNDALEAGLVRRGFTSLRAEGSTTVCALPPPDVDPVGLARGLATQGIAMGVPDGKLRFAPHWPNDLDQMNQVLQAIDALA